MVEARRLQCFSAVGDSCFIGELAVKKVTQVLGRKLLYDILLAWSVGGE